MSQLEYTGGGSFATSRRGGVDIDHLIAMKKKNPRASYQALSAMTGYSIASVRDALASRHVPVIAAVPRAQTIVTPQAKRSQIISMIDGIVREALGIEGGIWAKSDCHKVAQAREYHVLFSVRYTKISASDLANLVGTDLNLPQMRYDAYLKSKRMTANEMFCRIGRGIEIKIHKTLPEYVTSGVSLVF